MAKNITYDLTFNEALQAVMDGKGWAQGEQFKDGLIIMEKGGSFMDGRDYLHRHDFTAKSRHEAKVDIQITQGLYRQKYRIINTQADAMRKA